MKYFVNHTRFKHRTNITAPTTKSISITCYMKQNGICSIEVAFLSQILILKKLSWQDLKKILDCLIRVIEEYNVNELNASGTFSHNQRNYQRRTNLFTYKKSRLMRSSVNKGFISERNPPYISVSQVCVADNDMIHVLCLCCTWQPTYLGNTGKKLYYFIQFASKKGFLFFLVGFCFHRYKKQYYLTRNEIDSF